MKAALHVTEERTIPKRILLELPTGADRFGEGCSAINIHVDAPMTLTPIFEETLHRVVAIVNVYEEKVEEVLELVRHQISISLSDWLCRPDLNLGNELPRDLIRTGRVELIEKAYRRP